MIQYDIQFRKCSVLSNLYTQSPRIFHLAKLKFGPYCLVAKIVSDSLPPHGLQHGRLPCSSLSPGVFSNSCPLSQWFHPAVSSSAVLLSSWPQSFQASGSFPVSQFFTSGGQSIGASASAAVHPMNIQGWFPWGLTGLISPCPRDSQESSPSPQFKRINSSVPSFLYSPTLTSIHEHWINHILFNS